MRDVAVIGVGMNRWGELWEKSHRRIWAEAFAKRAVPQNVFGAGANGETPTGSDMEVKHFMQLLTLEAAERLSYDRNVEADQ